MLEIQWALKNVLNEKPKKTLCNKDDLRTFFLHSSLIKSGDKKKIPFFYANLTILNLIADNAVFMTYLIRLIRKMSTRPPSVKEIQIPVPWGHIAGKIKLYKIQFLLWNNVPKTGTLKVVVDKIQVRFSMKPLKFQNAIHSVQTLEILK